MCLVVAGLCILCRPVSAQDPPEESSAVSATSSPSVTGDHDSSNPPGYPNADPQGASNPPNDCDISLLKACMKDFLGDQAGIWTSPLRLRPHDALWLVPLAGATAVAFHYDVETLQQVSKSPNRIRISNDLSNAGLYGAIGIAGTTYLVGKFKHNETARKIGVIALEAMADSGVVAEVLKLVTNRERPYTGTGQGYFWPDGTKIYTFSGSFPSGHATIVWTFSHVISDATPGRRWLHLGLYAMAAGVSVARVTSRNHFPSDVVVGSALGYLVGGYVYRRHSNPWGYNDSAFSLSPMYDPLTRSYGMSVAFDPNLLLKLAR
jgi:membrane-associated phospholipid phosphatase